VFYLSAVARVAFGVIFLVSTTGKVRNRGSLRAFLEWSGGLHLLRPPLRTASALASLVAEASIVVLALGSLVGLSVLDVPVLVTAAVLLVVFAAATLLLLLRGVATSCQCFGSPGAELGIWHVSRDLLLAGLATAGATAGEVPALRARVFILCAILGTIIAVTTILLDDVVPQPGGRAGPLERGRPWGSTKRVSTS
jgi:hypothetical protein